MTTMSKEKILEEIQQFIEAKGGSLRWFELRPHHRAFLKAQGIQRDVISTDDIHVVMSWGKYSPNPQFPNIPQEPWGKNKPTSPIPQEFPNFDDDLGENDIALINTIKLYLTAISKVIDGADRTEKRLAIYLLLKNNELPDPDLRRELAPLGKLFSRNKGPYKTKTINNVISFVRNTPHIWVSKDDLTGVFVYRLKDETRKDILRTYEFLLKEKEIQEEQERLKSADFEELTKAAFEFLKEFYKDKVFDLFNVKPQKFLVIDWNELLSLNSTLADKVINDPVRVIKAFEGALKQFQREEMLKKEEEIVVPIRL